MRSTMVVPNHGGRRIARLGLADGFSGHQLLAGWDAMDGHSEAIIDLSVIRSNVAAMTSHVGGAQLMAVVKSDGYGHGMIPTARAALAGGASWLGVGHVGEAVELRQAGVTAPVLCLLAAPDAPHASAIARDVDLSAGTVSLVRQIAGGGRPGGPPG